MSPTPQLDSECDFENLGAVTHAAQPDSLRRGRGAECGPQSVVLCKQDKILIVSNLCFKRHRRSKQRSSDGFFVSLLAWGLSLALPACDSRNACCIKRGLSKNSSTEADRAQSGPCHFAVASWPAGC